MSTQSAQNISLTHKFPQEGFKLLELPHELADLLLSGEAPTFELKSPSQSMIKNIVEYGGREYINFCTPTETFQIRQVQYSNSLHILRPGEGESEHEGDDSAKGSEVLNPIQSLASIAKCGSILELHSLTEGLSAVPFLENSLEVYDRPRSGGNADVGVDLDTTELRQVEEEKAIETYFADVPVSRAQCEEGWLELCAFVSKDLNSGRPVYWQPSPRVKLDIWKMIVDGALLQGIDLERQFLAEDLWASLLNDDGERPFPRALFEAILRRVCWSDDSPPSMAADVKWTNLNKVTCMRWVGQTYLEVVAPTSASAIGLAEFLDLWRDHLPESWRGDVALSKLAVGIFKHPDPTSICFMGSSSPKRTRQSLPTSESSTAAKKTRNWHELFRNRK